MPDRPSVFDQFLHTHGLDLESPPDAQKWRSVMQVLRTQFNATSAEDW